MEPLRQAVILAGGKGSRLRSRTGELPKSLVDVGGTPLLGRQLALLREQGFDDVVLLVNYGARSIESYCKGQSSGEFRIRLIHDGEARGTAGAVLNVLNELADQFTVLYGDTMLNVDLGRFWDWHSEDASCAASLFLHPNDHPSDSDLVEVDNQRRIVRFHPYPHSEAAYLSNLVNAALYVVRRDALAPFASHRQPLDFAKDLFPEMLRQEVVLRGYISPEYIKDAGTPERLDRVRADLASGVVARSSLRTKQRAVFIDRDGTLNVEKGHLAGYQDLEVFVFVGPALRRLNQSEWRTVVITNQPVLARGEARAEDLRKIHAKLETEMAKSQAFFDRIYYCPHHPDRGFPGEVSELKISCECRKPAPGLIYQAQKELNIDLARSWFIGDRETDVQAAAAAGVRSILVHTGPEAQKLQSSAADYQFADFGAAVDFILNGSVCEAREESRMQEVSA